MQSWPGAAVGSVTDPGQSAVGAIRRCGVGALASGNANECASMVDVFAWIANTPRRVFPLGNVAGNGPGTPRSPWTPCGPRGPTGSWPALKSPARSVPFFTLTEVTAFLLIWRGPTLLRGSVSAA